MVLLAGQKAGIRNPEYELIGDDLVLFSINHYRKYSEIMGRLGVEVSPLKTHVSEGAIPSFEFAKKYVLHGVSILPLPARTIKTIVNGDSRGLAGLFTHLMAAGSHHKFLDLAKYFITLGPGLVDPNALYLTLLSLYFKCVTPRACRGLSLDSAEMRSIFGDYSESSPITNPIKGLEIESKIGQVYSRPYTESDLGYTPYQNLIFSNLYKHVSAKSFEQLRQLDVKRRVCDMALKDILKNFDPTADTDYFLHDF